MFPKSSLLLPSYLIPYFTVIINLPYVLISPYITPPFLIVNYTLPLSSLPYFHRPPLPPIPPSSRLPYLHTLISLHSPLLSPYLHTSVYPPLPISLRYFQPTVFLLRNSRPFPHCNSTTIPSLAYTFWHVCTSSTFPYIYCTIHIRKTKNTKENITKSAIKEILNGYMTWGEKGHQSRINLIVPTLPNYGRKHTIMNVPIYGLWNSFCVIICRNQRSSINLHQ